MPLDKNQDCKDRPVVNLLKVSIPMMLSQFLMTLGGFIGVFLLSFLSTKTFAASALISSTQLLLTMVPFALFFCISPMVSHFVAAKQNLPNVGVFFRSAIVLSLAVGLVVMIIFSQIGAILNLLGQPHYLVNICRQYFDVFLWVIPLSAINRVFLQVGMGLFRQKMVFLFSLISLLIFTLFASVFIFGIPNLLPSFGIRGLAMAYICQGILNFMYLIFYFLKQKDFEKYDFFNLTFWSGFKTYIAKIFAIGFPISVQTGNDLLSFFLTTMMVGWLGATALMAKQITVQYLLLLVIPLFGIGQASSTYVGKFRGEKNHKKLLQYGNLSLLVGVVYSAIVFFLFLCIPGPFIRVFSHGENFSVSFIHLVGILLAIVAAGQIFDSIKSIATGSLRGLGETKIPMLVSVISIWVVGLPFSYFLGFPMHLGLIGIALGHNVAVFFGAIILTLVWRRKARALALLDQD